MGMTDACARDNVEHIGALVIDDPTMLGALLIYTQYNVASLLTDLRNLDYLFNSKNSDYEKRTY